MKPRILAACAWTAVILFLCLLPTDRLPIPETDSRLFRLPSLDKIVHCGLFLVFAALWMRVRPTARGAAYTLAAGLALAALTEIGQGLEWVGRDPELLDAIADSVGVLLGTTLSWRFLAAPRPAEVA